MLKWRFVPEHPTEIHCRTSAPAQCHLFWNEQPPFSLSSSPSVKQLQLWSGGLGRSVTALKTDEVSSLFILCISVNSMFPSSSSSLSAIALCVTENKMHHWTKINSRILVKKNGMRYFLRYYTIVFLNHAIWSCSAIVSLLWRNGSLEPLSLLLCVWLLMETVLL